MPRRPRARPPHRARNVIAPFKPTFDKIARAGMAYCVRHAGYLLARELTTIAALTLFNEEHHQRLEPGGADVGVPLLERILRGLLLQRWRETRKPVNTAFRGKAYRLTGRTVGEAPSAVRRRVIGMHVLFRAVLAGEPFPEIPGDDLLALADRESEVALITDYLYLALSEEDSAAVEARLGDDAKFFERVWALVRVRELDLDMEDFMDEHMNPLIPPQASDETSPLYGFELGSWWLKYPISESQLAEMWELFKELRSKVLARGADPGAGVRAQADDELGGPSGPST